jgi:hypothetical protein
MRNETALIQNAELSDADLDNVSGGVGVNGGGSLTADTSGASGTARLDELSVGAAGVTGAAPAAAVSGSFG